MKLNLSIFEPHAPFLINTKLYTRLEMHSNHPFTENNITFFFLELKQIKNALIYALILICAK